MITTGKCPQCDTRLLNVKIEAIDLIEGLSTKWKGASYICPHCQHILGVEMDPTALRSAIVGDVKKLLGR